MYHSHTLIYLMQVYTRFHYGNHQTKNLGHIYVLDLTLSKNWWLSGIWKDIQSTIRTVAFCSWSFENKNEFLFNMPVPQSELACFQISNSNSHFWLFSLSCFFPHCPWSWISYLNTFFPAEYCSNNCQNINLIILSQEVGFIG